MKSNNCFVIAGNLGCALIFLLFLGCGKSESSTPVTLPPPPPPPVNKDTSCVPCELLYYGGNNSDAPTLDSGNYQAAARYTPEKIGQLVGKTIKEVRFYLMNKPDSVKVKIYGPSGTTVPGDLLYEADVTLAREANTWNIHKLTKPITLKNEDIWLSIEFKLSGTLKTIGCDVGPALKDGDWFFSAQDNKWVTYEKRAGESINWNVRLNVGL